jgi:phosphonate transport system substrate-binding protein
VGYVFSSADSITVQWVVSGRLPIGVIDNVTFDMLLPDETREGLIILAATDDVPRQLMLLRTGMEPELVAAIKAIFVGMDEQEDAQMPLATFLTTEFDEFPEGVEVALFRMQTLYELVQEN